MTPALFDTNIIIDLLKGRQAALDEFKYYDDVAISLVTWMEVMVGTPPELRAEVEKALTEGSVQIIPISDEVAARSVHLRYAALRETPKRKLKLPDAIIEATALHTGRLLVNRNAADFRTAVVRVPYEVDSSDNVINVALPPT